MAADTLPLLLFVLLPKKEERMAAVFELQETHLCTASISSPAVESEAGAWGVAVNWATAHFKVDKGEAVARAWDARASQLPPPPPFSSSTSPSWEGREGGRLCMGRACVENMRTQARPWT